MPQLVPQQYTMDPNETLRQQALSGGLQNIIGGLQNLQQAQQTQRQQALQAQQLAGSLREQGYNVTADQVNQSLSPEPSGIAKLFGAESPKRPDLFNPQNRTEEYKTKLAQQALDKAFQEKMRAGALTDKQKQQSEEKMASMKLGVEQSKYASQAVMKKAEDIDNLRKEIQTLPVTKELYTMDSSLGKMRDSAKANTPAGDMGLIFSYMKMLDPNSTVREGEYATAEQARGVPATILNAYNKVLQGTKLDSKQKQDFLNQGTQFASQQFNTYKKAITPQMELIKQRGYDQSLVLPNLSSFDYSTQGNQQNSGSNQAIAGQEGAPWQKYKK